MNRLLTILLLLGATAHGQIDNPPTSVNIVDSTATGRAVLTATNAAAAATAVGLGTTNTVTFADITGDRVYASEFRNLEYNFEVIPEENVFRQNNSTIFSWTSTNASFPVPVSFATNVTVGGTLAVTGNATLNGSDNLMPNATNAASASSLMTRDLSDERYTTSIWLIQISDNQTITNGGFQLLTPGRINTFSIGYGASVPSGFTEFRVVLGFGWLQNPATNSTNFPVFVQFENKGASSGTTVEAEHGTAFSRAGLYPTNAASTGLAGTLTRRAVFNTTNTVYSFISDWVTIPNTWQSNASSNGFYHIIGVAIANNTGGSLTDCFNANHSAVGLIEFRK